MRCWMDSVRCERLGDVNGEDSPHVSFGVSKKQRLWWDLEMKTRKIRGNILKNNPTYLSPGGSFYKPKGDRDKENT